MQGAVSGGASTWLDALADLQIVGAELALLGALGALVRVGAGSGATLGAFTLATAVLVLLGWRWRRSPGHMGGLTLAALAASFLAALPAALLFLALRRGGTALCDRVVASDGSIIGVFAGPALFGLAGILAAKGKSPRALIVIGVAHAGVWLLGSTSALLFCAMAV